MTDGGEYRESVKPAERWAYALLGIAALWSVFRVARSFQLLFEVSHDAFMYYALWFVLGERDMADIALRQSLYLPHTWLFLTPLFSFGWPVARILLLLLNLAAVGFIWWRLSELTGLVGIRRWLLLVFFTSWLSTGLVLGLGNLALICVAAAVAAYPYKSAANGVFLAFSAMKQSLVFPLYSDLLLRRPKALIAPVVIFAASGLGVLVWARLGIADGVGILRAWAENVSTWTTVDHTCLRRLFIMVTDKPLVLSLANWGTWLGLFVVCARYVKDPLARLAAMLLLSLLPMYHNQYDMVAAVPALAVLLKRCHLAVPTALTVFLATNVISPLAAHAPALLKPPLTLVASAYYPLLILAVVGLLVFLDSRSGSKAIIRASVTEVTGSPKADDEQKIAT